VRASVQSSVLLIIVLASTILPINGIAQSGRGRARVSQPSSEPTPPAPRVVVPAGAAVVKQEQLESTSRFVLRNGMTVVIDEQHSAPLVAAVLFVKLPANITTHQKDSGLWARVLQRILFRTSASASPQASMRNLGGWLDGASSADGSSYFFVAPSSKLKEALAIESGLLMKPVIDQENVQRESARAVEEQKARVEGIDLRSSSVPDSILEAPDLEGTDLGSLTPERLSELYDTAYRPENLVVVVAGDVVPYNALIQVQQLFGGFAPSPASGQSQTDDKQKAADHSEPQSSAKSRVTPPAETQPDKGKPAADSESQTQSADAQKSTESQTQPEVNHLRYLNGRSDIYQSVISVSFEVAGLDSPEWPAIELLAAIMGCGRGSRLGRALVDGSMVAARAEARYFPMAHSGVLEFQIFPAQDPRNGSPDNAESALFRELDRIRHEIPTDGELARARSILEQRFTDQSSSYLSRAMTMARAEASPAGLRAAVNYVDRVHAVSGAAVQQVAARYLHQDSTFIREREPITAPPRTFDDQRFAATLAAWAPDFSKPVNAGSVHPADQKQSLAPIAQGSGRSKRQQQAIESLEALPLKDFSTLNGPRAFVREDHSVPLVTIALLFQGGRVLEDPTNSGITELMLRSAIYGTGRRSYAQLTDELEQLGAQLEPVVAPDFFGFTLTVLSRNAERVLRILRDIVEEPSFRDEDVKRASITQLGLIRSEKSSPQRRARDLMMTAIFAPHGYSAPTHGRDDVVSKLTSDQLQQWHDRLVKRQLPLVVIVGDTDGSELVSGQIAEGFRRRDLDNSLQVRIPQALPANERVERIGGELSALAVGYSGSRSTSTDQFPLALVCEAMNGPGGRLTTELRDKQGIAVLVTCRDEVMFSAGALWSDVVTTPDNEARAKSAIASEFQRVARQGLTAEELDGAKNAALGSRLAALQSQALRAVEYARAAVYQQAATDVDKYYERVSKVTVDDVKRAASIYFKSPYVGIVRGTSKSSAPKPTQN
jgi:zinc protease